MLRSSFVSFYLWVVLGAFVSIQNATGDHESDDFSIMSEGDFEDLHLCKEPPPPMNGEMHCSKHKKKADKYVCKVTCDSGYQFPNGKTKARHICDINSGKWTPEFSFPDCTPVCEPPCVNGGECAEDNHCICTPEFRGDRCQYSLSLCDPNEGLHVTADWLCNHTRSETSCILNCPHGTKYESQPAALYNCRLDGTWEPSFAPKCVPINIIEPPASPSFYAISGGEAVTSKRPTSGVCATWSASHYRTFDGGIYNFHGTCAYLLAKDCEQNTFAIHVQNGELCSSAPSCRTTIKIYIGLEEFLLSNGDDGPIVQNEGNTFPVPVAVNGLLFQMLSDYVTVSSSLGFKLKWNRKNTISIKAANQLKNKTCGLCGKFDGSTLNDFETSDGSLTDSVEVFVDSWAMEHLGEQCKGNAVVKDSCSESVEKSQEAEHLCKAVYDDKFKNCHEIIDPKSYYDACRMDHCSCSSSEESCYCNSLAEYFRECNRLGGKIEGGWRNNDLCPLSCPNDMIYKDCGTSCPQTCKGTVYDCEDDHCIDGCHCPDGTVLHNGYCVERKDCPCLHNEVEYQNGERVLQDCNACECTGGKWKCTKEECEARCSSIGDPHYTTFDGLNYEFWGSCLYYLVYHENFTILQETGPCSELYSSEGSQESAFCTKAIKIELGKDTLRLEPGIKVTFNEKDVELPFSENGLTVNMATNIFLQVSLRNRVSVLWDGFNTIYIDVPPTLYDQTMGLCGTFNHNQNDDFQTPEKDIETDVYAFAARWEASNSCQKRSRRSGERSACQMQPQKLFDAEVLCSIIKTELFSACHGEVEPYDVYKACVNDLCSCGSELEECLCPILAAYSMSCTRRNIVVNWVDKVKACKPDCPAGQVYKECGDPCTCSCSAFASVEECRPQCVQGCTCPDGMTMNDKGFCIPIDQCPCIFEGKEYPSSDITVQGDNICTCMNANWQCRPGSNEELMTLKPDDVLVNDHLNSKCRADENEEFTECLEECPITCQNARLPPKCKTTECRPGCRCKEGFILDEDLNKCVQQRECGCIHATQRYADGDTIKQGCNLCSCNDGVWQCTEKVCSGICTAWGESHFKSFDGKIFDFQGECEYILSKGKMKGAAFSLSVQNVPCGTSGITCSKSFTLDLGPVSIDRGDTSVTEGEERLTLTRDDVLPKTSPSSRFVVLESGLFVLVYTDVGITLRWDRGTRIYVTLDPKWRNRVNGLCGNFNDDQADDFLTPYGGIPEARPAIFADSWKVQEYCPQSQVVEDMCAIHPQRKSWAQQKCGILKSDVFAACRAALNVEPFYERCVFDSCACDMGGDCDCLCTAIAAYAQECSIHGVPVKWRSQELCPIQCEECATYDSCISPCPKKTCENEYRYGKIQTSCSSDFCVEGCNPKPCAEGEIYNNEREYKCIPKADCVIPCLEVNGVLYNEGDRITDLEVADPCQSCHCHRGSVSCSGNPCVKIEPLKACLQTGWTAWMNTPTSTGGDSEELSDPLLKATYEKFCGVTNMTKIECRVAESKVPAKENGQDVVCELPTGFLCQDNEQKDRVCDDYEIRVFCDCGHEIIETTTVPVTTPAKLPPVCDGTGWTPFMSAHLPDETGEAELLDALHINHYFCADHEIENIECRNVVTWELASKTDSDVICNQKLGYVCKGPHCDDFEVRVFCNCGEVKPTVPSCVTGWTEYFNTDHPDRSDMGDDETIDRIRESHEFCVGGTLEDIECKAVINDNLVDFTSLDPFGLKCSKNVGFLCLNDVRTDKCPDFMVRFYCACEPIIIPPENFLITTTPTPVVPVPVECGWTPWLNIDTPDSDGMDVGDVEDLAKIQLLYKTCGGKDLVDIECRMSRTHHSYKESLQHNLQCDTQVGFRCNNEDQTGNCYDYEIRLLCMYEWCYPPTTTPIPTTEPPTTTQNPCPEGQVYDDCAYNCGQMCSSFVHEMSFKCAEAADGCIAGCRPAIRCEPPMLWRDYYNCVHKEECTCIFIQDDNVTIVAPNDIVIRDCEKCQCIHNDLNCYSTPGCGTTPETARPRILIPEDIVQEDCWTKWINVDAPSTGGGDLEALSKIRQLYEFCYDPVKIECRTASSKQKSNEVGQIVVCDLDTGLVCWNTDNKPEDCYDYEIRFFCPCPTTVVPTTTPAPTLEPGPCVRGWTDWFSSHIPSERGEYESVQSARVNNVFCANEMISAIQCKRKDYLNKGMLQRGVICDLESGLVCNQTYLEDDELCWDYEVKFFCDCPTEAPVTTTTQLPTTTTLAPTLQPGICVHGWTEWFNSHIPNERGEYESIHNARINNVFCPKDMISDIECNEVGSTNKGLLQNGVLCNVETGLVCNQSNLQDERCLDYEVRFFCDCPPVAKTETTPVPAKLACAYWSDWINDHHPSTAEDAAIKKGVKGARIVKGDTEKVSSLKLQKERKFCLEGEVTGIECREAETDIDYSESEANKLACSLAGGFRCRGNDQPNKLCKDYKIRYFCSCTEETPTTPVITTPTTPQIYVEPCNVYYNIIDGPEPLPDSSIKVSSSKTMESGPQSARLSSIDAYKTAGAWIAGDVDEKQFIEVDLGRIRPIYGIITKGRNGYEEWVKSYKVLYSRTGMTYAYVSDGGNIDKIFTGNFDSDTPVEHVFKVPVEARYVRIQPITFHKEIAMRMDVLGCGEGLTTVPIITTTPPPCIDDMGLSSGTIENYQIKTTSDRNSSTDGRYVRLNTPETESHSGGWVAEFLDEDQFVQIDFVAERVLTGVKIQGRNSVPQWVTAFSVSYSSTGITWESLSDANEKLKVFPGNYDSDSITTIYFPQPIRTRFIRIHPVAWENWIAMRLEILGCYERLDDQVKDEIHTTIKPYMLDECHQPMGFENHQLPDTFISVSSYAGPGSGVSRIRLNTPSEDRGTGGWIAAPYDYKPIIYIDFNEERNLTGVITQGLEDYDKWIMSYYVLYSSDNVTWNKAYDLETGDKVFPGNFDRNTPVLRLFSSMIQARYLKLILIDYHVAPALRMEVVGCFIPYAEITPPPPVLITTTEFCTEYGPWVSLSDPATNHYGDLEPIDQIISVSGTCKNPYDIQCRTMVTGKDYARTGQSVTCSLEEGLQCLNHEQSSFACYNYEVRIKCWTCGIETTTAPHPLILCPEVPEDMKDGCPVSCPLDYSCDGQGCVPHVDCPCYQDGKRFQPPNMIVTKDCQKCECILGGYSTCKPIECPPCLPGQKSEMDDHCTCNCMGCAEGTVLCPTNGECVPEDRWCDGVRDCADDEVDCPTTTQATTTLAPTTTTEVPIICTTDNLADTDSCEMIANMFETFDGLSYQYDICDHVLMKERSSNLYSVTVHKSCAPDHLNSCEKYLVIEVDGIILKIGPSVDDVTVGDNRVSPANFWFVSRRFKDFELRKKGNAVVFRSNKYHFDVLWDGVQDAKIFISKCLRDQVVGLCGFYNQHMSDDRTTPEGNLATSNEEFGDSWSIGSPDRCTPVKCPDYLMKIAIDSCSKLQAEPFSSSCADSLKMESRIESCYVFMCECLQRTNNATTTRSSNADVFYDLYDTSGCQCQAFESFVEACEAVKQTPVVDWRIPYGCTPECPEGMEWQDCGPGCELTCDNYHERDSLCSETCTPGCYCPSGMIRHHNRCVLPKMCQDCVCRGHGDPNYITFDGRYYAFQGNCTYVLAQHLSSNDANKNFKILGTNVECPEEPHTSCAAGLQVHWNGHVIEKFKNKPVYLDGEALKKEDSPFNKDGISITFVPKKSTIIHIKSINLAVRYFDQMYGFNIELPAFFYYNKTEGLCGVCNFIKSDDLYHKNGYVTEDIEDFAYSWLVPPDRREQCEFARVVVPEPPKEICNFTTSPCEVFLDPNLYSTSCQNDITYSHKPQASMCRSKFQYAQQCCERGISLVEWLKLSGCESSCAEGMHFECASACPKTCDNYKNYREEECDLMPLYTCTCPKGQVLKLGACVDEIACETCDALGHIVGDVWNVGHCEQCECMPDLSTRCVVTECPDPPICRENETLEKLQRPVNACCDAFQCKIVEVACPDAELQMCAEGEANVVVHVDECPKYKCECMPEYCPPLVVPVLDEGEFYSVEKEGCCPHYRTDCYSEKCSDPPLCGPGFKLSTSEGKCCLQYSCIPKKNVCVYQYHYEVVNGSQVQLSPEEYYEEEFEGGASWQDGLCRKCYCSELDGQYAFSCLEQNCRDPIFPDAEKYVYESTHIPGECCPRYHRVACKVNGVVHSIDSDWPSPDGDPCKSYRCIKQSGEAIVLEKRTSCDTKCPIYAEYVPPTPESKKCCGECKPVACEENGILYEDGATWRSSAKPCYTAECSVTGNGTRIVYRGESCPLMPDNCPQENIKHDPKGCCTYCKKQTENCAAVQVPLYETRGYFGFIDRYKGMCTNEDVLEDLTKCAGQCTTESLYSDLIGDFQSVCNCCVPLKTTERVIILDCEDGSKIKKVYKQPATCKCNSCSGVDRSLESMNRMEPY